MTVTRGSMPETWKTRMRDPQRWKSSLMRAALWFGATFLLLEGLSRVLPGEPMLVGSSSIPRGLYWQFPGPFEPMRGQYISYRFDPAQPWIAERYRNPREDRNIHAKSVGALPGDRIVSDQDKNLYACTHRVDMIERMLPPVDAPLGPDWQCNSLGQPMEQDSNYRPIFAWLDADSQYELKAGEVWIYGPNPKSLDSRYYGPVPMDKLVSRAIPLIQID